MPVCIVGMHRSGTSMVARALNLCGLYLGEQDDFLTHEHPLFRGIASDNPEGYWENLNFVLLNIQIFEIMGGDTSYRAQPSFEAGWPDDSRLNGVREKAQHLVDKMNAHPAWGWKDPRNTLTLPFWQSIIPDLKVIVCVRHPLEVAYSLMARGFHTEAEGLNFWSYYYQTLESALPHSPYLVTNTQTYFYDAKSEIARLAAFARLECSGEAIGAAAQSIKNEHHRNLSADFLLESEHVPPHVAENYRMLCDQAGTVYKRMQADSGYQTTLMQRASLELYQRYNAIRQNVQWLESEKVALTSAIEDLQTEKQALTSAIEDLQTEKQALTSAIDGLQDELEFLRAHPPILPLPQEIIRRLRPLYRTLIPLRARLVLRDLRAKLLKG